MARDGGGRPTSLQTATTATPNDAIIEPQARAPAAALLTRRPRKAFSRNPANGNSGIRTSISARFPLPFQRRERVRVERLAMPEETDHDGEPDGGLGRRDRHHEEHDDLPVDSAQGPAEGDEGQVHRVQHDLDRQENRDQVAAKENPGRTGGEQDRREHEGVVERGHYFVVLSRRASTTAPTIATRISTEVTSNWKA